jgi:hypothetical protein
MEQLAIVARLKEGAEERARELIAGGPPFDPADAGPFQWPISDAFEVWRPLVEGEPRLARPCYSWHASSGPRAGSGSSAP